MTQVHTAAIISIWIKTMDLDCLQRINHHTIVSALSNKTQHFDLPEFYKSVLKAHSFLKCCCRKEWICAHKSVCSLPCYHSLTVSLWTAWHRRKNQWSFTFFTSMNDPSYCKHTLQYLGWRLQAVLQYSYKKPLWTNYRFRPQDKETLACYSQQLL